MSWSSCATLLFGAYWLRWVWKHWIFPRIPGPTPWPLLGNLLFHSKNYDRFYDTYQESYDKYGPVFTYDLGGINFVYMQQIQDVKYVLSDVERFPKGELFREYLYDLLGDGIFNADGESWYMQRKTASYEFSLSRFRDYMTHVFAEHTERLCVQLERVAAEGTVVDLQDLFQKFTFDSIVKLAFGVDINSFEGSNDKVFMESFDTATRLSNERFVKPKLYWQLQRALGVGQEKVLADSLKEINDTVASFISTRRQLEETEVAERSDLLSRFMAVTAPDEDGDKFLRDMCVNFILAGRDTTASMLSWCFYEIQLNPTVEADLHTHVDAMLPDCSAPDYHDMRRFHFGQALIAETLRLHPPVPVDSKVAREDGELPSGQAYRKGDFMTFVPYQMGRSTEIWGEAAAEFAPSRWLDDSGEFIKPDLFRFPVFQAGPRKCLGMDQAYLQGKVCSSMIARRFRIRLAPGVGPRTYVRNFTMPIKDGLPVTVTKR